MLVWILAQLQGKSLSESSSQPGRIIIWSWSVCMRTVFRAFQVLSRFVLWRESGCDCSADCVSLGKTLVRLSSAPDQSISQSGSVRLHSQGSLPVSLSRYKARVRLWLLTCLKEGFFSALHRAGVSRGEIQYPGVSAHTQKYKITQSGTHRVNLSHYGCISLHCVCKTLGTSCEKKSARSAASNARPLQNRRSTDQGGVRGCEGSL